MAKLTLAERARIIISVPDDFPAFYIDCDQLARVIQHLFENALCYAPSASSICFGARATSREVRLWVEDSGPGVAPDERAHIFEKFFRGSAAHSAPAGTGLGLAIAAEIIRSHQGRIWVEDVQPHGARFLITLPRQDASAKEDVR
jgi:two-component system sensor histidine kinase KdpD